MKNTLHKHRHLEESKDEIALPAPMRDASPALVVEKRTTMPPEILEDEDAAIHLPEKNAGPDVPPAAPADFVPEEPRFVPIEKKEPPVVIQRDYNVWGTAEQRRRARDVDHRPLGDRSSNGGFIGFLHDYLPTFFGPRSAPPPAQLSSFEKEGPKPAPRETPAMDLDSLLGAPAPGESAKTQEPKPTPIPTPALPNGDLLAAAPMEETKRVPIPATKILSDAPMSVPSAAAPKKEEAKWPVAEKAKPETPARKEPPAEIVFKAMGAHKVSAWAEFLGSLRYFGLGKERSAIIQNLSTMLNAGLGLIDSLKTLQMETRVKPAKNLLGRIVEAVENGSPLWRAMEDQHFFSPQALALIRIGEEAGNLAENMEYLAIQQEKDAALVSKVKMAMIYPIIVFSMMFVIVIGLGMFVLPNLIGVLLSLNVPLPLATRAVIAFTNLFTKYGAVAVPSFLAGFVLLTILGKFTRLKVVMQWFLFRIPGIGRLVTESTIARFGVILGGLLQAGVPLVDALRSLAEVTPIVAYKNFYFRLLERINLGDSFAKSFELRGSQKILPISVQQLVVTGEKSGSLAKILLKIADIYEKKANDTAQKLPVILEPMLLLFIGGLVGTIAFSIIVPIYSIVGNIGH